MRTDNRLSAYLGLLAVGPSFSCLYWVFVQFQRPVYEHPADACYAHAHRLSWLLVVLSKVEVILRQS